MEFCDSEIYDPVRIWDSLSGETQKVAYAFLVGGGIPISRNVLETMSGGVGNLSSCLQELNKFGVLELAESPDGRSVNLYRYRLSEVFYIFVRGKVDKASDSRFGFV